MTRSELLTVEDCFTIEQIGLIVIPDFSVPHFSVPHNDWKPSKESVTVQRPDGITLDALARFDLSHFNISDPDVPVERRWRVTICLLDKTKEDVPIGSKLLVRKELAAQLLEKKT